MFKAKFDGHTLRISGKAMAMLVELICSEADKTYVAELHELEMQGWKQQRIIDSLIRSHLIDFNGTGYYYTDWAMHIVETQFGKLTGLNRVYTYEAAERSFQ